MIVIVQCAPALRMAVQVVVFSKGPVVAIPESVRVAPPVLVSVTIYGGLEVPTGGLGKFKLVGDSVATGPRPAPVRLTVCGFPAALS